MSNLPGSLFYSEKSGFRLLRHAILIISMIIIFSWIVYLREDDAGKISEIFKAVSINSFFFFGYAYVTAYLLVPWFLNRKKYTHFVLLFLFSGLLISFLKFIFSDYIFYNAIAADLSDRMRSLVFSQLLINTKDMTFIVALFLIAKYSKDNYQNKRRVGELKDHQILSEIRLLKNQLDPHVVFNNLNNIYSLALNDSASVAPNLARLRFVLSYYLVDGTSDTVSLEKEIQTIKDYISLEKLRYGERLNVEFTLEGETDGKRIIPFVLFPFVENCFEHGCSIESGSAWIRLFLKSAPDSIVFHASNSKPVNYIETDSGREPGIDLRNKLELLYPGRHLIRIEERKDMYSVDLKLRI